MDWHISTTDAPWERHVVDIAVAFGCDLPCLSVGSGNDVLRAEVDHESTYHIDLCKPFPRSCLVHNNTWVLKTVRRKTVSLSAIAIGEFLDPKDGSDRNSL
jgi:hypothetical protein